MNIRHGNSGHQYSGDRSHDHTGLPKYLSRYISKFQHAQITYTERTVNGQAPCLSPQKKALKSFPCQADGNLGLLLGMGYHKDKEDFDDAKSAARRFCNRSWQFISAYRQLSPGPW